MWLRYLKFAPFYLLSLLPLTFLYGIASLLFVVMYHIVGYRKKVVRSNMSNAFPDWNKDELDQNTTAFYKQFSRMLLESLKVLSISKTKAKAHLHFKNLDLLNSLYNNDENVILYGAHMGNWEWFAFYPLYIKHQFVSFYQEQSNSYFNELSILMRERFGNICIESRSAYKQLLEMNRKGTKTLAYMLADQSPMVNSGKEWTNFLGQSTAFLQGAERISRKAGHKLIYPFVRMPSRGQYEVEFIEISTEGSTNDVISRYAQLLEENIRSQPELWLWSHRRWKLKAE